MSSTAFYRDFGKRCLDLAIAGPLLVMLLPAMGVVALLVRFKLGSPVFFRQTRPGLRSRPFEMLKFRTMIDACDAHAHPLPDDQRLTRFGRWLRSTSLDELPELWHVIRGEMSLVGPRPLLTRYLDRYTPAEARRHDVRPGITGWAQVQGRNAIDWDTRLAHDVWYVDHLSLRLDLAILVRTIGAVLRRSNINQPGHATVAELRPHLEQSTTADTPDIEQGVVVLGAGGHAKVVIATLQAAGQTVSAVLDDNPRLWGQSLLGVRVAGPISSIDGRRCRAVIAIGDNVLRRRIAEQWPRINWLTVIHPSSVVHASVLLGPGTVICAGAVIQPDARIGSHTIINTSASVDHDSIVGDHVHVAPGARLAGQVRVDAGTLIGIGACVTPGIRIGAHSIVGAGSAVVNDLPDHIIAYGTPARVRHERRLSKEAA